MSAIKIGCPAIKLARIKGGNAGKRTGSLQAVLCEGWECEKDKDGNNVRYCKDQDYDRTKTAGNRYEGIKNAFELGKQITEAAENYSLKRYLNGGKRIKKTAAIGYSVILKPPSAWVNSLPADKQRKLADDLLESFRVATADMIRQDTINGVWQEDEGGGHWHIAGAAITPDGDLNADAIINPRFYTRLNSKLPEEMRKRGWLEIDNCVNYDPDKAKDMSKEEKEAYKKECLAKRPKKAGQDSADYKAQRDRERLEAAQKEIEALKEKIAKLEAEAQKPATAAPKPVGDQKPATAAPKPVGDQKPATAAPKPVGDQKPATAAPKPVGYQNVKEDIERIKKASEARRAMEAEAKSLGDGVKPLSPEAEARIADTLAGIR